MNGQAINSDKSDDRVRISQRGDRKLNQDRCEIFDHENIQVMVLADGMGGHPRGEVAAQILVDTTYHLLNKSDAENFHADQFIRDVFQTAHRKIIDFGLKKKPPIRPRTTAVLVVIQDNLMQWSHLGDSRTYLFRHGRAHMRTLDHTNAEKKRLAGEIEDSDSQSQASGRSGVSRCLGSMKKITDIEITPAISLQEGDILMLCTDGVWSQVREVELETIMLDSSLPLYHRVNKLVSQAIETAHPHSDNATAMALCWHAEKNDGNSVTQTNNPSHSADQEKPAEKIDSALDHLRSLIDKYQ